MAKFKRKRIILNDVPYITHDTLGQGKYGVIYLAKPRKPKLKDGTRLPKWVAIKEYFFARFYDPSTGVNDCEKYWKREIENLKLQGKYMGAQMKFIDADKVITDTAKNYYIVLTQIDGTTLKEWFFEKYGKRPHLDEEEINKITREIVIPIARHLNDCHQRGLIHRDLTTDNVLIKTTRRGACIPVIIDWGSGKIRAPKEVNHIPKDYFQSCSSTNTAFMNKGTPPEVMSGLDPVSSSDVYMLGHLMYFLFSGGIACRTPATHDDFVLHPKNENPTLDEDYDHLVEKCTQYDPSDRIKSMEQILHILEKMEEDFSPSQITHFDKPVTFQSRVAIKQNPPIGSGSVPNRYTAPNNAPGYMTPQPSSQGIPQSTLQSASQGGSQQNTPSGAQIRHSAPPSSPNPVSQPRYTVSAQNTPSNQNLNNSGNPLKSGDVAAAVANSALPQPQTFEPHAFSPDDQTVLLGKSFLTYFQNPRWEYQRQDHYQYYFNFFSGVINALEQHNSPVVHDIVPGSVYFVGLTGGAIDDIRNILNYFQRVIQKAPSTKIIFLGKYFNLNKYDIETFTLILSLYCLYPNNVRVLRSTTEEQHALEMNGAHSHLQLKFGGYYKQIYAQILAIVARLHLLHIADLGSNVKCLSTGGGIPYDTKDPNTPIDLRTFAKTQHALGDAKAQIHPEYQSIIWGVPNEMSDTQGTDSKGNIYYSWSQLKAFFAVNGIQFLFRPDSEKSGFRQIWNMIGNITSASIFHNQPKFDAKIVRLNLSGMSDLAVKNLNVYFDRDYANL